MKRSFFLFILAFSAFYMLSFGMRQLPEIVHGHFSFAIEGQSLKTWVRFTGDMALYYILSYGSYLILYRFYPLKKIGAIFFLLLLLSVSFFCLSFFWTVLVENSVLRVRNHFHLILFASIINLAFGAVFYFIQYSQFRDLQHIKLQLQNRQTELSFLRSQINPHFLFNNLNNIYSLVHENNSHALPAIANLADLLRYMLYNVEEEITLEKEVDYLNKFVYLQQLRFENPLAVEIKTEITNEQFLLPPLILLPFIENAFKHGMTESAKIWLKIILHCNSTQLFFECSNLVGMKNTDETGGIGIENVKKRLELIYPHKHTLTTEKKEDWYVVKMTIKNDK
jgi:two-component system, LytTR family, sensor kinase